MNRFFAAIFALSATPALAVFPNDVKITSRDTTMYGGYAVSLLDVGDKDRSFRLDGTAVGLGYAVNFGMQGGDAAGIGVNLKAARYINDFGAAGATETIDHAAVGVGIVGFSGTWVRYYLGISGDMLELRRGGAEPVHQRYNPALGSTFGIGLGPRGAKAGWQLRGELGLSKFDDGRDFEGNGTKLFAIGLTSVLAALELSMVSK